MKTYYVPVYYTVYGRVPVEANNSDEAIKYALQNKSDIELPEFPVYVEDSFQIDEEGAVLDDYGNVVQKGGKLCR